MVVDIFDVLPPATEEEEEMEERKGKIKENGITDEKHKRRSEWFHFGCGKQKQYICTCNTRSTIVVALRKRACCS